MSKWTICVVEEVHIDREPPLPTAFVPGFNDSYLPEKEDRRALILDLNGLLLCHFKQNEQIPEYVTQMTEVEGLRHGERLFVMPEGAMFLLWCMENFTVFIWSATSKQRMETLFRLAFPEIYPRLRDQFLNQAQCKPFKNWDTIPGTDKPILFKCLSYFWDNFKMFNDRNTVIVEDSAYKCFQNPRQCCLITPKFEDLQLSEIPRLLTGKIMIWLWNWLRAECRHQYAFDYLMHTNLDTESLAIFHMSRKEM